MMQAAPGALAASRSTPQNRDLTVLATVGAGAEVIADGSIHIYGALRGRALAGAQGNEKARIFCREFHAELVAIAGHYKVLEDIPEGPARQGRAGLAGTTSSSASRRWTDQQPA